VVRAVKHTRMGVGRNIKQVLESAGCEWIQNVFISKLAFSVLQGELLETENAYFCELCSKKVGRLIVVTR